MSKGNSLDKNLNENKLPRYSFGIYGCWVNDENNNLSYVNEEDYTDEMQDIQSEIAQKINVVLPWADNHIFTYDS